MKKVKARSKSLTEQILARYTLCKPCLSRQMHNLHDEKLSDNDCHICGGLVASIDTMATKVISTLSEYEYDTFLVGATIPYIFTEREDALRADFKLKGGETLKTALTRELGRIISRETGKKVSYRGADITVIVDPEHNNAIVSTKPLFLSGRYVKRIRGLPQRKRKCRECRGTGCSHCDFKGEAIEESVEKLLEEAIQTYVKGKRVRFTWIGGEDANSLVLGEGRPFFAEVSEPKVRTAKIPRKISTGEAILIKELQILRQKPATHPTFAIRVAAHITTDQKLSKETWKKLSTEFKDRPVTFLSTRKGRRVEKKVYDVRCKSVGEQEADLMIECDGGLTIRGLIGEGTRPNDLSDVYPSFSEVLGAGLKCGSFDVLEVNISEGRNR